MDRCPLHHAYKLSLPCVSQVAKWTGDFFNHGIYDIHIHLRGVPLLEWETEVEMDKYAILCISILPPAVPGGWKGL
jgi:hypothetical protein